MGADSAGTVARSAGTVRIAGRRSAGKPSADMALIPGRLLSAGMAQSLGTAGGFALAGASRGSAGPALGTSPTARTLSLFPLGSVMTRARS